MKSHRNKIKKHCNNYPAVVKVTTYEVYSLIMKGANVYGRINPLVLLIQRDLADKMESVFRFRNL